MPTRPSDSFEDPFEEISVDPDGASPFTSDSVWFDDEAMSRHDNLVHLMQLGRHVLIIEGEPETGRSTVLDALVDDRNGLIEPLILDPEDLADSEALAQACIQRFDLPTPPAPSGPRVVDHAEQQLAAAIRAGERPVVMVDDADDMPAEGLAALLQLRAATATEDGAALGVVLTARRGLAPKLIDVSDGTLAAGDIHVSALHPWRGDQIADYIRHELGPELADSALAGPLDPAEINDETMGLPGRVVDACHARWYDMDDARPAPRRSARLVPRRQTLILAGGLLAALLIAYALFQTFTGKSDDEVIITERTPPRPAGTEESPVPATGRERLPVPVPSEPATTESRDETAPAIEPLVPEIADDTGASTPGGAVDAPRQDETRIVEQDVSPEPETEPVPEPEQEPEPEPAPEPEPDGDADAAEGDQAGSTTSQDVDDEDATPQPAAWIDRQPGEHLTIQLIGASRREALEQYRQEQLADLDTHIVATRRDGADWYVVVTGSFPERNQATERLAGLPPEFREAGAWIRSIESLRSGP